jgi:hypothetical protein
MGALKLSSTGIRSPDCLACSESVYWLSYPGTRLCVVRTVNWLLCSLWMELSVCLVQKRITHFVLVSTFTVGTFWRKFVYMFPSCTHFVIQLFGAKWCYFWCICNEKVEINNLWVCFTLPDCVYVCVFVCVCVCVCGGGVACVTASEGCHEIW